MLPVCMPTSVSLDCVTWCNPRAETTRKHSPPCIVTCSFGMHWHWVTMGLLSHKVDPATCFFVGQSVLELCGWKNHLVVLVVLYPLKHTDVWVNLFLWVTNTLLLVCLSVSVSWDCVAKGRQAVGTVVSFPLTYCFSSSHSTLTWDWKWLFCIINRTPMMMSFCLHFLSLSVSYKCVTESRPAGGGWKTHFFSLAGLSLGVYWPGVKCVLIYKENLVAGLSICVSFIELYGWAKLRWPEDYFPSPGNLLFPNVTNLEWKLLFWITKSTLLLICLFIEVFCDYVFG